LQAVGGSSVGQIFGFISAKDAFDGLVPPEELSGIVRLFTFFSNGIIKN